MILVKYKPTKMINFSTILLILLSVIFCGCSNGTESANKKKVKLSRRDEIRFKQYKIQGQKVYSTYCSNCHQPDGKGLAEIYPPLANADYLMEDLKRASCIIKYGQSNEIVVNGKTYNQMMPGNPITNLEIAEVLTFITNNWENEAGLIVVKDVDKWLINCEE